jgi:CheY-like chemotaxis protein
MEQQTAEAKRHHVLVVDDNLELAQTYKHLLEEHGYVVTLAPNGVLALKIILKADVDAIVCDLKMPQLEGDMFYMTVERVKPSLCPRFIFITGMGADPKFQKFIKQVQVPVLFKPVAIHVLLEEIGKAVQR